MALVKCERCGASGWCERHMGSDWTVHEGLSNSSPAFFELQSAVEQIIRNSGADLIAGRASTVARLIMAQLAHVHGVGPLPAGNAMVDFDDVIQFLGEQASFYRARGNDGGQFSSRWIVKYARFVGDGFLESLLTFTKNRSPRSEWRPIPEFTAWLEEELARRKAH
jgi:hypothetical protein